MGIKGNELTIPLALTAAMSHFTEEDKKQLEQYVTSTESDIFALKNLNGIAGAVYARYSRAKTGFRETLLREFIEAGQIDAVHANELIERVLVAYGDDSVGELEGAHVSFENISIIATKEIEDRRIGGSPIEKSTRYVFFDEKDEAGKYKYVREPKIMASQHAGLYEQTMDYVFDAYSKLIEPMQQFYANRFPIDQAEYDIKGAGSKQKLGDLTEEKDQKAFRTTYKIDMKTKACDSLRCLLPLATKTNVGMFGNGRYFQTLISHLYSTPYPEVVEIGQKTFTELSKIIPQYVRRAAKKDYTIAVEKAMQQLTKELLSTIKPDAADAVAIVPVEKVHNEISLVAHMLYAYSELSFVQVYSIVEKMDATTRERVKATYVGTRKTRRDRPGRAMEAGYTYTIDLFADYGTYKDLERHRMTTQLRQPFSPRHGLVVPRDIADAGFEATVLEVHDRVAKAYEAIFADLGEVASYVTLHGSRVRWIMGFNDREAMHLLELRTAKQGHPQYRKLCQQIHNAIAKIDPWRASIMQFVDHNDYDSARGDSEARQRVKERQLDEKFSKTAE